MKPREFTIGQLIRSDSMTREERVQIFGEPVAALLDVPVPTGPLMKPMRVLSVDRDNGVITFGEDE